MTTISTYIGGAGVGKTTKLLNTMAELITTRYPDPRSIGFVSFTRAARQEAATRAADRFNVRVQDLERDGWFRTLHSVCYKLLGVGDQLLVPGRETQNWIQEAIQEPVTGTGEANTENEYGNRGEVATHADAALAMWSFSRNAMVPLDVVYDRESKMGIDVPGLGDCRRIAEKYEQAKRLHGRVDFTDLLSQFAGVAFSPKHGPSDVAPAGEIPDVPVWFIDEAQDNSALIDRAARRLTSRSELVYLSGDPFQAVHTWAGGDHHLFQKWNPNRVKILDQSYRCPDKILALGESCLKPCSDYWNRSIRGRPSVQRGSKTNGTFSGDDFLGSPIYEWGQPQLEPKLDPRQSWLLLARTNFQARRLMALTKNTGVPWRPLRGNGGWNAPARNAACESLLAIEQDTPIDGEGWNAILKFVPVKSKNQELLTHGTKVAWERGQFDEQFERYVLRENLLEWGATQYMLDEIRAGRWTSWIENGSEFRSAVNRFGFAAAMCREDAKTESGSQAGVRIGTVHSAKGMEADNVLILTTSSSPVAKSAALDQRGADEESRVAYVGVTRARERLFICTEKAKHRMPIPMEGDSQ